MHILLFWTQETRGRIFYSRPCVSGFPFGVFLALEIPLSAHYNTYVYMFSAILNDSAKRLWLENLSMDKKDRKTLDSLAEILPQLTYIQKEKLLSFGEGMAFANREKEKDNASENAPSLQE